MNADKHLARAELVAILGELKDPRHATNPAKYEQELKNAVRACWKHREHFPDWIHGYIERWSKTNDPG